MDADVRVLDRACAVGESWRQRYDRRHLHTHRVQSALPGRSVPRRFGRGATGDVARYIHQYAEHHGLVPRFGTEVRRLEQDGDAWRARTAGPPLQVRQVVTATGYDREPVHPDRPGQDTLGGELLHASAHAGPLEGLLRHVSLDARAAARAVARELSRSGGR
jgi:putative flavoprotein involved in K+ transport